MLETSKLGYYFETILEIIEDKPNFIIPIYFYCILVQVLFHQIGGYILSNFETKPLGEEKISFIAHINEVSPITFLLFFKGNDTLSLICFFLMQFLMYFYFIYVGVLTYIKNAKKYFFQQNQKIFRTMNQFLNVFFTFYWWLFFTPYIEINSGMLVCGDNSFLVQFRGKPNCNGKSPLITILSILGLILTISTALIIVFFFRNYEFNEQNLLKRRFHYIIVVQLIGRFLLTFFYYLNLKIVLVFKHIIAQFIAVAFLYDTIMNWPFSNHMVAKFYSCASCIFEIAIFLCNSWMFSTFMPGTEFFYYLVFLSLLSSSLMIQFWRYKYECLMKIDESNFGIYFRQTDFFLEEIVRLLIESQKNEQSKFKLFETIIYHQKACTNLQCHCKKVNFKKGDFDLNEEDVFRLVDSIFKWALKSKQLQRNNEEFEHLSLKYISYLAKYRNNTSRAYYELKMLLSQRTNISFYFKIISKILSRSIETQMEQSTITSVISNEFREDLELSLVWRMEELKQEFVPKMVSALQLKVSFWEKMKQGFNKMEDCMNYSIKKIKFIEQMDQYFSLELSRMNGSEDKSYIFYKVCSMFEMLVKNQIVNAMKLEISANELRKRDQSKSSDIIHNFKLAKQEIISFLVSFAKERGKIVSKRTSFTAKFFGYDNGEVDNIKSINDLMPKFIATIHNELMENMNWKGKSKYIKGSIRSYCADKQGFIYPIKVFLDHSFGHFDDFCMLSSILKVTTSNDFIVFDQSGKILGITESVFSKIFSSEKKMNIQRLYKTGFIFLLFKEIINQINHSKKEIATSSTDQQLIHLTATNKGFFNLNQNFGQMFDHFQLFLEQSMSENDIDKSKTVASKTTFKQQKQKQFNTLRIKESSSLQQLNLDLLNDTSYQLISKFFDQYSQKRQELQNQKGSMNSENGSQNITDNTLQIRMFFKYQLQYEILRYNENKKEQKLFHLILSDIAISKRKVGQGYQSNMSLNTFVNSTQVGGASSYRLKTFISKGGDTDLGNSVKLSDDRINELANKQSQFAITDNNKGQTHRQDENILDTNNQFENKFEKEEEDNWTHTEKGVSDNGEDEDTEADNNDEQNKGNGNSPAKSNKKNENLEYIQEVSNKDEDTAKQNSVKNMKSEGELAENKVQKNQQQSKTQFPPQIINSKQSTIDQQKSNQESQLDKTMIQNSKMGLVDKSMMMNDSILNDSHMVLINNNNILNSSFCDEQQMVKNNLGQLSTKRNDMNGDIFSVTNRNEGEDESQRRMINLGPNNRQAEFFSPTNNMRTILDNDEILITMDDQKGIEPPPPINLRFNDKYNEIIQEQNMQIQQYANLNTSKQMQNQQTLMLNSAFQNYNLDNDQLARLNSEMKQQASFDDDQKNEDMEKDIERIKKNQSLKESKKQTSAKVKKKKHSLKSENNIEDDGIQQQSMASHSSIRSSYGTQFVREILNQKRLPTAAKNYNRIQKVFLLSFFVIILVNIFFLAQQINKISSNMDNYVQYANLTNSCSKGLFSMIGLQELQLSLLTQNIDQNRALYNQYLDDASATFTQSFQALQDDLINIEDDVFKDSSVITFKDYDYKGEMSEKQITVLQFLYVIQNALKLASSTNVQTSSIVSVALYQIRYNYITFMDRMYELKNYQDDTIDQNISYINSLYIISSVISCLISIIVVITSIPMIRKVNLYKEKIILLVTRISIDDADIEISKYKKCIEQLTDHNESYLNVDFFKIFTSRRKFHRGSKQTLGEEGEKEGNEEDNNGKVNQKSMKKKERDQQTKQKMKQAAQSTKVSNNYAENRTRNKYKQNVISSKIFEQKLGLTRQFFNFLSFSFITIGFFIIILVYVIVEDNKIIPSLRISRTTINTQYSLGSLYVFSELLVVENEFSKSIPYYPSNTLSQRNEMKTQLDSDINIIELFNQDNINNVYGDNVISSSSLTNLKDLYQNSLCLQFPNILSCQDFNEGISGYISQLFSLITSHNTILNPVQFPVTTDVLNYLQSAEHQKLLTQSYLVPDYSLQLFVNIIVDANVNLVKSMSQLIQIIFYSVGPLILVLLALFFYKQWLNLTNQLNSLSFLLTLIPEEKISEEITLQMLKQIRSF